ncbi:hypothetical protein K432DRAFT_311586 [Lepidopterella palustris CBS 459.81]|uniref:Glycoprotease family protein n=1 Tax=Lepidopterella palustris CBS 459.81 TaxID=1314670 RepID=A0A8E2DYI8_9PEZI|nr:hypothetical protein K432DRAFT_311586 [Lepidopterella palustris CBS 459.81]
MKEKGDWDTEASRVAARKAMTKRNSRALVIQNSRTKSRRKAKLGRSARPGITVDTSFARHRGNTPRQVFPQNTTFGNSSETTKKSAWWHLGRSTPKADNGTGKNQSVPINVSNNRTDFNSPENSRYLMPARYTSMEVSPSDRPITIGISIPSDSLSEHHSYRTNRERSGSDVTLVTPSIIVTPAVNKSVWSPDSEVDYRSRPASSIYSQAAFYVADYSNNRDVPPMPALPSNISRSAQGTNVARIEKNVPEITTSTAERKTISNASHARNSTVDSAVTAFEEDDDHKQKDRIMSTGTVFEEDESPILLGEKHIRVPGNLTIDTTMSPTPRRSRGWWNVITTPFEVSRSNSVWTRRTLRNGDTTPDVPMIPHRVGMIQHHSPDLALSPHPRTRNSQASTFSPNDREIPILLGADPQPAGIILDSNNPYLISLQEDAEYRQGRGQLSNRANNASLASERDITSPLSAATASTPVLGVASVGTVLMPREIHDRQRQLSDVPELAEGQRPVGSTHINVIEEAPRQVANPYETPRPVFTGTERTPAARNVLHRSPRETQAPPAYSQYMQQLRYHDPVQNEEVARGSIPLAPFSNRQEAPKNSLKPNCFGRKKRQEPDKRKKRRKRCWLCGCCCIFFLALVAIIASLVVTLTRKHNHATTTPSQWLNLTGYPPIPTGISTIAQPEAVVENSGCVSPATIWSCALPKEEQASIAPNKADQPNFRLEIIFQNGTIANSSMTQVVHRRTDRPSNPLSAGAFIRSRLVRIRDQLTASPPTPGIDDQKFLGNTTDGNSSPFEGEQTPFFITFLDPTKVSSARLAKRSTDPFDNITSLIPPPAVNSDGTAAAVTLLPLPNAQPLRLYNRGLPTEHYGFYNYFDRSIFLKSITPTNSSFGGVPADTNGGSSFDSATLRCVWAQTRFLVQIWTNAGTSKPLLAAAATATSSAPHSSATAASISSANDFARPGSFPYPVTVTLDRHGGVEQSKMIYCYGMDTSGKIVDSDKTFVLEDRAFGGIAVNPSDGPFSNVTVSPADGGPGGIDGGTGGCMCQWANWLQS